MATIANYFRSEDNDADASTAYANQKSLFLSIYHLPSQVQVNFKAFITTYNETFSSEWNQEKVFGRNDPIATFKGTGRAISVGFDIPAYSLGEAKDNLARCNRIAQFMYPAYEVGNRANTIAKPPLLRLCFANLIRRAGAGDSPNAFESGLLGFIRTVTVTPSFEDSSGFFDPDAATLYPKVITVSFDYVPLHEHDLGWGEGIGFNDPTYVNFPFGKTPSDVTEYSTGEPPTPDNFVNPQAVEDAQAGPWAPGMAPGEGVLDDNNDGGIDNAEALAQRGLGVLDPEREMEDFGVVEAEGASSVLDPSRDNLPYRN
tara:strand:- start:397 stop:1341 length:945 start_codon:yes stop_codon:yes gene_type:complete